LVPGDSLAPFLGRLLGRRRFAEVLAAAGPGMVAGYRRGGRDAAKAALLRRALSGLEAERAEAEGRAYGRALAHRIRPEMSARIRWHRGQGHHLVLVSAALMLYLGPFATVAGFDQVIATRLEVGADGRLTGRLEGRNVRAGEKARLLGDVLRAMAPSLTEVWAYGDSAGDRELLEMADHPTLVGSHRPWRRARDAGRRGGG